MTKNELINEISLNQRLVIDHIEYFQNLISNVLQFPLLSTEQLQLPDVMPI